MKSLTNSQNRHSKRFMVLNQYFNLLEIFFSNAENHWRDNFILQWQSRNARCTPAVKLDDIVSYISTNNLLDLKI